MSDHNDDTTTDDLLDMFNEMLDSNGVAASTVQDGTLIAFKLDKLQELIEIANGNENKKVIILIANDLHHPLEEVEDDQELKN